MEIKREYARWLENATGDQDVAEELRQKFEALGIEYFYTLIDDAVARVIRSKGGFIWAC